MKAKLMALGLVLSSFYFSTSYATCIENTYHIQKQNDFPKPPQYFPRQFSHS